MATPWPDHPSLAGLLAGWRRAWSGRELFAVSAGRDWVRLHLAGEEKAGILLVDRPGARLVAAVVDRLPPPLHVALTPSRHHPLRGLLDGARLANLGVLPDDRVVAFAFTAADGARLFLLHRLFGARGNTVLLAADGRTLWARHRPAHPLLTVPPPDAAWSTGTPVDDTLSVMGLDRLTARLATDLATTTGAALERRRGSAERLVENLSRDLENADRGDEHRRRAEALAAALHTISRGDHEAHLADLRDGTPLVVPLDPSRTPAANLEVWFRKARKAERGRDVIATRLAAAQTQAGALRAAAADLGSLDDGDPLARLAALQAWRRDHAELLPTARVRGRSPHAPDEPSRPFRRFLIEDTWEVWVGRHNRENDELTHRASHGRDLWFHAQGVPGSHVVLRTGGRPDRVPGRVIEKAAAIAALHSKARHAGLVPVVWTERRYVRKPRKAAAGTAVCLQEKSIFAEPGLAPGVVAI